MSTGLVVIWIAATAGLLAVAIYGITRAARARRLTRWDTVKNLLLRQDRSLGAVTPDRLGSIYRNLLKESRIVSPAGRSLAMNRFEVLVPEDDFDVIEQIGSDVFARELAIFRQRYARRNSWITSDGGEDEGPWITIVRSSHLPRLEPEIGRFALAGPPVITDQDEKSTEQLLEDYASAANGVSAERTLPYGEVPDESVTQTRTRSAQTPLRRLRIDVGDMVRTFDFQDSPISVGRSRACAIVIDDPTVSNVQLELVAAEAGWEIRPKPSKNVILVDEREETLPRLLEAVTAVRLGRATRLRIIVLGEE